MSCCYNERDNQLTTRKTSASPRPRLRHSCASSSFSRIASNISRLAHPAVIKLTQCQYTEHAAHAFFSAFLFFGSAITLAVVGGAALSCRSVQMRNK